MPRIYFIGVDVGTSSTRAALVDSNGEIIRKAIKPIQTWNPKNEHFEQSSEDIWQAVCTCVKLVTNNVAPEEIAAISFDATCSLVILGEDGIPLSFNIDKDSHSAQQNVILWMDHRAHHEAEKINATHHQILEYVGGKVSVEMQLPKLLWLKSNCYETIWSKLWRVFDLCDFLTWRSTNCNTRSLCSVACKWNYDAMTMSWNREFMQQIGLEDLLINDAVIIGNDIREPGSPIGYGLCSEAAKDMNLLPGIVVGTSLIDAHAGALAMFGCHYAENVNINNFEDKLALICGTSTCHLSLTREPRQISGIWGPYRNAIIPGYFLREAGQSSTGVLIDHVIKAHPQFMHIKNKLLDGNIYKYLNELLIKIAKEKGLKDPCYLTKDLHVWPDFHGNRSPLADGQLKGMISGLNMNSNEESLSILYLAIIQSLAYGTRHIIESLFEYKSVNFRMLLFCGGLANNTLYVQSHADICQLPALLPVQDDMMLVGSAILAAYAAKVYDNLEMASLSMGCNGKLLRPHSITKDYHERKYRVFLKMLEDQRSYNYIMHTK